MGTAQPLLDPGFIFRFCFFSPLEPDGLNVFPGPHICSSHPLLKNLNPPSRVEPTRLPWLALQGSSSSPGPSSRCLYHPRLMLRSLLLLCSPAFSSNASLPG